MKPNQKSEIRNQKSQIPNQKSGFTLVELMVVVVIIGILVGLIVAAVIPARNKARNAAVSLEINQLDLALKAYKEKFGAYPPDFTGVNSTDADIRLAARALVIRHLRKAFPRYVLSGTIAEQWVQFRLHLMMATGNPTDGTDGLDLDTKPLTPASALAFWLGGIPARESTSSTKLIGFSANPGNPFDNTGSRLPALFEFDDTRLSTIEFVNNYPTDWPEYYPQVSAGSDTAPYVYFRARGKEYGVKVSDTVFIPLSCTIANCGICVPYLISSDDPTDPDVVRRWNNPKTFQIISAGLDGQFGNSSDTTFRFCKSGTGFSPNGGDYDNLTNFTRGKLEDEME